MDTTPPIDREGATDADPAAGLAVCPYFRGTPDGQALGSPIERPDARNRCAALNIAITPSDRQQELVCLTGGHRGCPRFVQGEAARQRGTIRRPLGRATVAAIAAVVLAAAISVAFVLARGSLELPQAVADRGEASADTGMPAAAASPSALAVASVTPSPDATDPVAATQSAAVSPPKTPDPTARPTSRATAAPTARPTPPPTPAATPRPTPVPVAPTPVAPATPRSDRYALLTPCADRSDCWVYAIRSGDNLFSIANYFGVPLETVYGLNPWTRTTPLRAGQALILPPPTR